MVHQDTLTGNWHAIVGAIKEKFGQITGDDLTKVQGNVDQLVGMLQRKTGETKESIERFLSNCANEAGIRYKNLSSKPSRLAEQASETLRDSVDHLAHRATEGLEYARSTVRQRPTESLLVVAGMGLLAGIAIGVSMASRQK